jgi:sulfite exporter TauE/SafE
MFQPEFIAALSIGFLGSLHCLGMCGPIALITPSPFAGSLGRITGGLIYNMGRVVTYSVMGLFVGLIGQGFNFFDVQQIFSIVVGAAIILFVFIPWLFRPEKITGKFSVLTNRAKNVIGKHMQKTSAMGILSVGLANGLLPCGLVYLGLAGSLEMFSVTESVLFMTYFGLGTIPMMLGIHLMGYNLKNSLRRKLSSALPALIVLIGLMFIVRGMGLGIPYLSPSSEPHEGDIHCTIPAHRH